MSDDLRVIAEAIDRALPREQREPTPPYLTMTQQTVARLAAQCNASFTGSDVWVFGFPVYITDLAPEACVGIKPSVDRPVEWTWLDPGAAQDPSSERPS